MRQIAKRRQMLKDELQQVDQELLETKKEQELRIEREKKKQEKDIRLRGGKFVDARDVPAYMATSLQIDHDANNQQNSKMAAPCFTEEYASTHAYGGQVYRVFKPGKNANPNYANLGKKV